MGKQDVLQHCKTASRLNKAKRIESQPRINFARPSSSVISKRTVAELKMTVLSASSDIPLAFHDRLSTTIGTVFPDSEIASKYHSAATKATCMLNNAVAPTIAKNST